MGCAKHVAVIALSPIFRAGGCLYKLLHCAGAMEVWRYAGWKAKLKHLGENVVFYRGVVIHAPQEVSIGAGTRIADYVHMWGGGGIEVGRNVLIAAHSVITSITHDPNALVYADSSIRKKVIIRDNVWIGSNSVILPGVTIGAGAIIGAGAVVTGDVVAGDTVAGVPARSIKSARRRSLESVPEAQRKLDNARQD
jgi:maltose O-acetyltransferase